MEFEDSRKALFTEPNAFVQNINKKDGAKKIVFSEPYESLPNYYLNNNFKKGECNCVTKPKEMNDKKLNEQNNNKLSFLNGLNIQNLMPLLSLFSGGSGDLAKVLSSFSGKNNLLSNDVNSLFDSFFKPDFIKNISGLFLQKKHVVENNSKKSIKSTDFEIKNYTKVD